MCRTLLLLAKVCTARKVARSSFPLICRADSSLDHCPLVQKPLQHAPQPPLEASDLITRSDACWWIVLLLLVPRWIIHQIRSYRLPHLQLVWVVETSVFEPLENMIMQCMVLEQSQLMQVVAKTPTMCAIWCTDTCCTCRSFLHSCLISFIFAFGSLKVIVSKSVMNPRYSILCVALQSDFSILITKPRDFSRFLDNWRFVVPLHCICLWSANCPGSWLFSVLLSGDFHDYTRGCG